ncbi:MAG: helix-turn-helix domain-containing protein [Lentisphaeria bacterium]|nr:helix-turn-helix transcriptional regulator [Victivallales bacterium]MBR6059214.1 helix-turn-helix transcriptional regulator [Victivallales bacterium]MCR4573483.1 helix-turn-helix domain-containing protein [Lentisphaeria bacterium]
MSEAKEKKAVSEKKRNHHRVVITEEMRNAMQEKRKSLGLSFAGVAQFIGVHWSTYRKWENGETTKFTREIERRVKHFLDSPKPVMEYITEEEDDGKRLERLIHRLRSIYRMCQKEETLREKLTTRLEHILDEILGMYSQTM